MYKIIAHITHYSFQAASLFILFIYVFKIFEKNTIYNEHPVQARHYAVNDILHIPMPEKTFVLGNFAAVQNWNVYSRRYNIDE